jgi:hypothetical protein
MTTPGQTIHDATAWTGDDVRNDASWQFTMDDAQRADLRAALASVKKTGLSLPQVRREDFPIGPGLRALADGVVNQLKDGRGMALVRGFPVDNLDDEDVRLMYWGWSQYMGTCVSQDPNCALIADVKEKGLGQDKLTRAYGNKHGTRNHVDLADVVGLLGVRQAPMGALSTLASSVTIYNEFVRQHPEWLPAAYEGFYWDRYGEQKQWEQPTSPSKVPLFSIARGQLSTRYNRNWITAASVRRGVPFTDQEAAMLDFFDEMGRKHGLALKMSPGDVYFANNYVVLHGRESYEETDNTPLDQKRLFLRVWFNVDGIRAFADESLVRFGLTSHGNVGFTSSEVLHGRNLIPNYQRMRVEQRAGA